MQNKLPWCLIELLVVIKLAKGVAGSKRCSFLVRWMEGLRAGWPLATLILIAVMYSLPSAAAAVAMETNFEGMDGAGRPFSRAQQVNRMWGRIMEELPILVPFVMIGRLLLSRGTAARAPSSNARSTVAAMPVPCTTCQSKAEAESQARAQAGALVGVLPLGAVRADAGVGADAAPEGPATGIGGLQLGAVRADAGVAAHAAPEAPATGIGVLQLDGVNADAGVVAQAAPEAPATGIGVLQLRGVNADAGGVADAAPEAPATGISVLQLGGVSADAGAGAEAAPEAPATGTGELQLGAVGAGARFVADAASYAAPEAPATGIGEVQLRAVSAGVGVVAEAAPEAPVTGIGKLQWGAVGAGAGGFADAAFVAPEAPATGIGKMQLGAVSAGVGVVDEAAPEAPATGISSVARWKGRKRQASPAAREALARAAVRAQGEAEADSQARAEAAAHAWDETRLQNRRLSGVGPLRRARLALDPKLRRRHLQEGRFPQDEDAFGAARHEATTAAHTGAAVESQAEIENAGQAAAQASAEERLPTEAVSSGGELGPCPHGLWCGCDLCPAERFHQVEAALETARQEAATAGKARGHAEAAAESQAKAEAAAQAEAEDRGHDARGSHVRPASRQWEPSECIAFAAAMAKEVAQRLCPHPGRATGVVGRFTADLEWLAAGAGPHDEGWPESLLPRGGAGEIWWPVWWCPGAGVEAHLSADSSRQEEAAPALAATMQGCHRHLEAGSRARRKHQM